MAFECPPKTEKNGTKRQCIPMATCCPNIAFICPPKDTAEKKIGALKCMKDIISTLEDQLKIKVQPQINSVTCSPCCIYPGCTAPCPPCGVPLCCPPGYALMYPPCDQSAEEDQDCESPPRPPRSRCKPEPTSRGEKSPCCPPACLPCCPPACPPCMPCNQPNQDEDICDSPDVMVCYKLKTNNSSRGNGGKGRKKNGKSEVIRVKKSKSRELRASILYVGCECEKRNGLQDDCPRTDCQGSPACLTKPDATCGPSEFAGAKHLQKRQTNGKSEKSAGSKTEGGGDESSDCDDGYVEDEYQCFPAYIQGMDDC